MIHVDLGDMAPPELSDFRHICERASLQFTDNLPVATWFYALSVIARREEERRGDATSTRQGWPWQVPWAIPDNLSRRAGDDLLAYLASATAAVSESVFREARAVSHHLHDVAVQLAELGDQRRAESRLTRRLLRGMYLRPAGSRPDREDAA